MRKYQQCGEFPINESRFKLGEQLALLTETSFKLKNKEF